MEKELKRYLRPDEQVRWQGRPTDFPLFENGTKFQILLKWIMTLALSIGLLVLYLRNDPDSGAGFVGLVILVAGVILASPLVERRNLRRMQYWITDQRAILMTGDKSFYYMDLADIDEFRVVRDVASEDCLVLGSCLFPEVHKQLRWRSCHPKTDLRAHDNQDCAMGMAFYCISNAAAAVALLEQGNSRRAA